METKFYLCKCNHIQWSNVETMLLKFLSNERKNKILNYRQEKNRITCLYSGLLVRLALIRFYKCRNEDLKFEIGKYGKPFLSKKSKMNFNLSHSGDYIFLGISEDIIGVDIEKIRHYDTAIVKRCFHPLEIDYIQKARNKDLAFCIIWTRKEAYFKCIGTGLSKDINLINTLNPSDEFTIKTNIHDGYAYSICLSKKIKNKY